MVALAAWLDFRRLLWCHVPNESRAAVQHRVNLRRQGVKSGVPDVLIFGPPHAPQNERGGLAAPGIYGGVALELKAGKGRASPAQKAWLDALTARGWLCSVQHGAQAAIAWLQSLGY